MGYVASTHPLDVAAARRCRVCGCTWDNACVDPDHGPCWWVEADLCSHCGEPAIVAGAYTRLTALLQGGAAGAMAYMELLPTWSAKAHEALKRASTSAPGVFEV